MFVCINLRMMSYVRKSGAKKVRKSGLFLAKIVAPNTLVKLGEIDR